MGIKVIVHSLVSLVAACRASLTQAFDLLEKCCVVNPLIYL